MKLTKLNCLIAFFLLGLVVKAQSPEGELKRWHKVSLTFNGPNTSETANPNPFSEYRLEVTFTHQGSNRSIKVPGYYAACGNAENNSCTSGNKWRVHFAPEQPGVWNWSASFKKGLNVAINGGGSSGGFMDGSTGSFNVAESDKGGRDHRAKDKGMLRYVGQHYLRYTGTNPTNPNGNWFVKAGADAPENTLAYEDFDATPNRGNRRKSWGPHQQDYQASDASGYTWNGGKGTELLGVVRYLSNKGLNAFSFLTLSLHGDDENVFPHALKVGVNTYNGYNDGQQWNQGVHKDRFDVSKLAQWEKVFEYADKKGMFMHFKTLETENDNIMDNNGFGRQRKLYYRELVARFGHHLALNWNLAEETTIPDNVVKSTASYIKQLDPYDHHIVIHTYPAQQDQRYNPLLGNKSELTGASVQTDKNKVHNDVRRWLEKSRNAGKKWVVANDEQGSANIGVDADPKDNKLVRQKVLWGTLMAGGMGVEYYYGYQTNGTDLNAQNHRTRDAKYTDASRALQFFNRYLQGSLSSMVSADGVTGDGNDYVLAKAGDVYAVYRPNGGSTGLNLPSGNGNYDVQWYNPRSGGNLTAKATLGGNLVAPANNDWVALITKKGGTTPPNNAIAIPGKVEAEDFNTQSGIQAEPTTDVGGGQNIGFIQNGDFATYKVKVNTSGKYTVDIRVASANSGGKIVFRSNGVVIGEATTAGTGGWQNWQTVQTSLNLTAGEQTLRLDFVGGASGLYNINWLDFKLDTGGSGNTVPQVTLTSPSNGTSFDPGATISLSANASDADGTITKVAFFVNGNLIATEQNAPYQTTTTINNSGNYVITAVATDNDGATKTSTSAAITIRGGGTDGCVAIERNGVAAVEAEHFVSQSKDSKRKWYLLDGSTTGTPTPDPDPNHANGASDGAYLEILPDTRVTHSDPLINGENFSNVAGQTTIVDYKVKFSSPGKYYVWVRAFSTGSEDNGVHVGINGTWPASGNRMQWCAGKNQWTWESKQRTAANHCGEAQKIFLNVPSAGVHTISFSLREDGFEMDKFVLSKAYTKPTGNGPAEILEDCGGTQNAAPQVVMTSPTDGTGFVPGENITLKANASDSDGTVSKVEFYIGDTKVGEDTTAPYQVTTTIASEGTYNATARATDNKGASATSTSVIIEVENDTSPPDNIISIPGNFEVERFTSKLGSVRIENTPGTSGKNLGYIKNGDYTEYTVAINSSGKYTFDVYAASAGVGGAVDIIEAGKTVGSVTIPVSGQWHDYKSYAVDVSLTAGEKKVRLVYKGSAGFLFNMDKIMVSKTAAPVEQTITLSPIHDAYLQGATRFNSEIVRLEQNKRTGYLMFDLSSINGTVTSAQLKFTVNSDSGNGNLSVYKGNSDTWTESNLSNSNKPSNGVLLGNLNTTYGIGSTKTIILTTGSISGSKLSLVLSATSGNDFAFASKENGANTPPQLVITYTSTSVQRSNFVADTKDDNNKINVYPNPAIDWIKVSGVSKGSRVKIFNAIGILQKEVVVKENQNMIDVNDLPSGYYILNVYDGYKVNKIVLIKE